MKCCDDEADGRELSIVNYFLVGEEELCCSSALTAFCKVYIYIFKREVLDLETLEQHGVVLKAV